MRNSLKNIYPALNNTALISSRDHQDQRYEGRDNSGQGPPDSNASSSRNNQRDGYLWDHPRLPHMLLNTALVDEIVTGNREVGLAGNANLSVKSSTTI